MPAPKGNKYAVGTCGTEKKWKTKELLEKAIAAYFKKCDENKKTVLSKMTGVMVKVPHPIPYTVEGLCEILGCDRVTLLNYEKKEGYEEYFSTVKWARMKIQRNKVERGLMGESNAAVSIFDLKNNHGYEDTSKNKHVTDDGYGGDAPMNTPEVKITRNFVAATDKLEDEQHD